MPDIPEPTTISALLWVIVIALATSVGFLYRRMETLRDKYEEKTALFTAQLIAIIQENIKANQEVSDGLEALFDERIKTLLDRN